MFVFEHRRLYSARLRGEVTICEQHYGFMPGKSTTDAVFALRMLMKKYREGQKELHCVFVDLEKALIGCQERSCGIVRGSWEW